MNKRLELREFVAVPQHRCAKRLAVNAMRPGGASEQRLDFGDGQEVHRHLATQFQPVGLRAFALQLAVHHRDELVAGWRSDVILNGKPRRKFVNQMTKYIASIPVQIHWQTKK